ncbi:hypothetical protein [Gracilimonas sediminicola]|uniref:HhH-GPD domain-containing protein n=1 Tax=Gracilimonas sediminicola TaxID=2952158 RepID=A0A9X2L3K1_9BACT|nr:hypothetical protein [Gracilimonas sediminicola]MCP9291632.1 hypothetical protein [Gracilimonas sediminicola]
MEVKKEKIEFFQDKILEWYEENGRHFPWRNKSATNYEKIISEVLLQRTRAETVANFFPKFIKKYPSWKKLGEATKEELQETLKPTGLYKQRGTRLYKLAQEMKERKGRFPVKRDRVEEMPMMGQYNANAYELFILKKPSPLLDVNMARVLERFFGERKLADIRYDPYLQELSQEVVENPQSKEINWGILDFGSLVCEAKSPLCEKCLLSEQCIYFDKLSK